MALAGLIAGVTAQPRPAFQRSWGDAASLDSFEECQLLSVVVESLDSENSSAVGVALYYMLAFEAGGVPTTSMIGYDPTNLCWQANHKQGSSLMLIIVDSNGSAGGVPQPLYSMTAGDDISCLKSLPSSSLATVHANVSDTVLTCEPLGLSISGGQKPYTVVLSEMHSDTITVVTLANDNDTLTYISRVDPDWQLIASVYDASGHWGTSTNAIRTSGPEDTACLGLETSQSSSTGGGGEPMSSSIQPFPSGTSVSPPVSSQPGIVPTLSGNSNKHTQVIVGVIVGVGVPLLLAAVLVPLIRRYRRRSSGVRRTPPDLLSSPAIEFDPIRSKKPNPSHFTVLQALRTKSQRPL
ncbi:uncharacterized protein PHACADRAFT_255361 [Phanerochaete carnosa HHB-10118-sp]|uniref:Mid2 domain-containing protein n=1 Tax=Phanerochaete carnosa (strain HHB-10118-sp) TaxID=650164 RepID=K5W787_PHACS|nr:uncharacterized protein PHACADRAFT_255361 [Phanerochaete carnosa HHB-10118-sp]EKM55035.1 hypothetical protein PHACADRAFT_255361 [Phanerochaete carnosa HHB-10118-sp]